MRIALGLEYDGSRYIGWQEQRKGSSVQQALEKGLSVVANHKVTVFCAGRTDTQVHASHQVVHFDSDSYRDERSWVLGANSNTPHDISVLWAKPVDDQFHARFSALSRSYRYIILNRYTRPALNYRRVTWVHGDLNVENMHEAGQLLLGEHDFSAFRAQHCQSKSPVRLVKSLHVQRINDYIMLDITANAFLYHMVRNIAGSLIEVGRGERPVVWLAELLHKKDRTQAGITAPANGLYLCSVEYPAEYQIPLAQPYPRFS